MNTIEKTTVTVETTVKAPIEKVWTSWTDPQHITKWCQASPDWHAPYADNDVRVGGSFKTTMAAKDGSFSFDFGGKYTAVEKYKKLAYTIEDGRNVEITFVSNGNETKVIESFETESQNPVDMQRAGWQAILDNFGKYTETL